MRYDKPARGVRICMNLLILSGWVLTPFRITFAQSPGRSSHPDVSVSGHFDVQAVGRNAAVRDNDFRLGQLAVDLSSALNPRVIAAMELAYGRNNQVAINEAFIDWNLFRWDGKPRRQSIGVTQSGLKVGQFDVPFGIDWRSYPSISRELVSIPLAISNTHRGWNDLGVQFYGVTTWSNWAVWAVNGFGTSPTLRLPARPGTTGLTTGDESGAGTANSAIFPTEAFGARFGLFMNDQIEFGTSFGTGYTDKNQQDERLFGFDLTMNYNPFELKGEYLSHRRSMVTSEESVYGYYVQGAYTFGKWYGVLRQDMYHPDGGTVYPLNVTSRSAMFCTSAGCGYHVGDFAQVRAEYQLAEGRSNDTVYLQTVVAF